MPDMVTVEFLVVPTIRFKMLFVIVVLSHDCRRVVHFNVTANLSAQWTAQQIVEAFPWIRHRNTYFEIDSQGTCYTTPEDKIFGRVFQSFSQHPARLRKDAYSLLYITLRVSEKICHGIGSDI